MLNDKETAELLKAKKFTGEAIDLMVDEIFTNEKGEVRISVSTIKATKSKVRSVYRILHDILYTGTTL